MGCRPVVFDVLRSAKTSAADHALSVALLRLEGAAARPAVEALLARQTREGLHGLIAAWHRLDEPLRDLVLSRRDEVFSVLREAFSAQNEQTRTNVVELIRRARFYRASYLLDSALRDRATAVRIAAAQAAVGLAEELLRCAPQLEATLAPDGTAEEWDQARRKMAELENYREDRRQLVAAVEAALSSFELHQHAGVVEAAMWLADDLGARLWKMLLAPGNRLTKVAQGVLGQRREPRLVPFMLAALGYAEFRPIVAQVLASCTDPAFLQEWFRQSWRLAEPKIARGLAALRGLACTRDKLLDLLSLPDEVQRHLPRCILATGLADAVKLEVLRETYRRGASSGQRAALWSLVGVQDARGTLLLRSIAAQGDPRRSWIARCELARRRPSEYPPGELLPEVVTQAAGTLARAIGRRPPAGRMTAAGYWQAFDRLSEEERLRLGRELMADGRLSPDTVAGWLSRPEPGDIVRALRITAMLNLAGSLEEPLYRLSHDPRPEVRSAAVIALGKVPTQASRRVLHNALHDPDPRVQANSVEALERLGGQSLIPELLPKLVSQDNRTRANAVRALLKVGVREAAETLLLMLRDENRAHRTSALWLVEHMNLLPLAAKVMDMAESDSDQQLRTRARILAGKIMGAGEMPAVAQAAGKEVL